MLSFSCCTSLGIWMGRPRNLMIVLSMKSSFWPERVRLESTDPPVVPWRRDTPWHWETLASVLAHPYWSVVFNCWQASRQFATRQVASAYCMVVTQYAELWSYSQSSALTFMVSIRMLIIVFKITTDVGHLGRHLSSQRWSELTTL